jgi:hypothetical protein
MAVALTLGLGVVLAAPAQAATQLGGLSVSSACYYQWGASTYPTIVGVNGGAYNWRCRLDLGGTSSYFTINFNQECNRAYGGGAWASPLNASDPYSWRCWR